MRSYTKRSCWILIQVHPFPAKSVSMSYLCNLCSCPRPMSDWNRLQTIVSFFFWYPWQLLCIFQHEYLFDTGGCPLPWPCLITREWWNGRSTPRICHFERPPSCQAENSWVTLNFSFNDLKVCPGPAYKKKCEWGIWGEASRIWNRFCTRSVESIDKNQRGWWSQSALQHLFSTIVDLMVRTDYSFWMGLKPQNSLVLNLL